jgi:dephospho-CoA kinase
MPKMIIGFVGQAGAGKGTAADILATNSNAEIFTFSDILADVLKRLYKEKSRDNLIKASTAIREAFGQDALANVMEAQVQASTAEIVIVDGIRRMEDIEDLQKDEKFHLVEIWAPPEIRYKRLKNRNEKTGEGEMTWEEFLAMGERETERTIAGVAAKADHKIENDLDLETFKAKLDELIATL